MVDVHEHLCDRTCQLDVRHHTHVICIRIPECCTWKTEKKKPLDKISEQRNLVLKLVVLLWFLCQLYCKHIIQTFAILTYVNDSERQRCEKEGEADSQ